MREIFAEIPNYIREQAKLWFDLAIKQDNPILITETLKKFRDLCTEEQKPFVDFYFNLRFEELKKEKNND